MMMRSELKEYLKNYWFRYAITFFGVFFMICGEIDDDPKLALFVCSSDESF